MRRLDVSIAQRFALGFALLALVFGVTLFAVSRWHAQSVAAQRDYFDRIAPRESTADDLETLLLYASTTSRQLAMDGGATNRAEYEDSMARARAQLHALEGLVETPAGHQIVQQLIPAVQAYFDNVERRVTQPGAAVDPGLERELRDNRSRALSLIREFTALQERETQRAILAMGKARETVAHGFGMAGAFALVAFFLLGLVITRALREPFQHLLHVAAALEAGDWHPALALAPKKGTVAPRRDEMSKLARALGSAAAVLQRRERRLGAEGELGSASAASLDKERIAKECLAKVLQYTGAELGAVYRTQVGSDSLLPIASHAVDGLQPLFIGDGVVGQAAKQLRPVWLRDIPSDAPFRVKLGFDELPPRVVCALPLVFHHELLGVMLLASLRELDADHCDFLEHAAGQLASGLQNVRSYNRIERLADELHQRNQKIQLQNEELQSQSEELQAQSEELQAQNEELQSQSEELHRHVNALGEVDVRRNEFLAVLAHELRNPLASITTSLFLLSRTAPDSSQATRARAVIERQTQHLARLVDDLLDVTRIAHGKIRVSCEPVEITSVVRACLDDYSAALERKQLAVDTDWSGQSLWVDGDRTRLSQVIGNLLNNAVKFTEPGGRVQVGIAADQSSVRLWVKDTGMGIEPDVLGRLFTPFMQGQRSAHSAEGGLGLGLALVKGLVEQHHGEVSVHSDGRGKGTEVRVVLPRARLENLEESFSTPPRDRQVSPSQQRILIIEDNADVAEAMQQALELCGHTVHVAATGPEGLEMARALLPDAILCDIGLPGMDGLAVARALRADATLRQVLLVAVSGYATPEDKARACDAGFAAVLAKPACIDDVLQVLQGEAVA